MEVTRETSLRTAAARGARRSFARDDRGRPARNRLDRRLDSDRRRDQGGDAGEILLGGNPPRGVRIVRVIEGADGDPAL
jgi:hypothetical protein